MTLAEVFPSVLDDDSVVRGINGFAQDVEHRAFTIQGLHLVQRVLTGCIVAVHQFLAGQFLGGEFKGAVLVVVEVEGNRTFGHAEFLLTVFGQGSVRHARNKLGGHVAHTHFLTLVAHQNEEITHVIGIAGEGVLQDTVLEEFIVGGLLNVHAVAVALQVVILSATSGLGVAAFTSAADFFAITTIGTVADIEFVGLVFEFDVEVIATVRSHLVAVII